MRLILFLILGVLLWAGTVSIKYPQQPVAVTASSAPTCSGQFYGDRLLDYLKVGTITRIHDNGQILTIGLSPRWEDLEMNTQQETYDTIVCYAQSLHRPLQILISQEM